MNSQFLNEINEYGKKNIRKYEKDGLIIQFYGYISALNLTQYHPIIKNKSIDDKTFCVKIISFHLLDEKDCELLDKMNENSLLDFLLFFVKNLNEKDQENFVKFLDSPSFCNFKTELINFTSKIYKKSEILANTMRSPIDKITKNQASFFPKTLENVFRISENIEKISGNPISSIKYNFTQRLDFDDEEMNIDDYIEKQEKQFQKITGKFDKCCNCEKIITDLSFFRAEFSEEESKRVEKICSIDCLKEFKELHSQNTINYKEVSRCTAYYKCLEIGNLRKKCEYSKNINGNQFNDPPILFCDSADAGIILSTHKMIEVLDKFERKSDENDKNQISFLNEIKETSEKNSNKLLIFLEDFKKAAEKQAKTTFGLTLLIILLTIINIIGAFIPVIYKSDIIKVEKINEIYIENKEINKTQKEQTEIIKNLIEVNKSIENKIELSNQHLRDISKNKQEEKKKELQKAPPKPKTNSLETKNRAKDFSPQR